ncbi:MAG: Gfo/Idh/MocA family protein [Candidatus Kryptoniota bacterium]
MNNKIKIGVVGVGHLGETHSRLLNEIEEAELVGVYDIDEYRSQKISRELNVRWFSSLDQLLESVNAVSIVSPTSTHFEIASTAIKAGKHCFIEKPISTTVEEAESLCEMASSHGVKLQVGHIERFNPAILALSNMDLDPMFVESHRLAQFKPRGMDVAVVLDLMVHDIDLILNFIKSPISSIDASGVGVISDTIDIANARIKFENGAVANVTSSRISQRQMRKMRLFQKDSYISIDFTEGLAEVYRAVKPDGLLKGDINLGVIGVGDAARVVTYYQAESPGINPLKHELTLFLRSVINDLPTAVSGEEAAKVMRVADAIVKQIEKTKQVVYR